MKIEEYRDEVKTLLVKVDTRQEEIFYRINRIEKHVENLNGSVMGHEKKITALWSYGVASIFIISIAINVIMRLV